MGTTWPFDITFVFSTFILRAKGGRWETLLRLSSKVSDSAMITISSANQGWMVSRYSYWGHTHLSPEAWRHLPTQLWTVTEVSLLSAVELVSSPDPRDEVTWWRFRINTLTFNTPVINLISLKKLQQSPYFRRIKSFLTNAKNRGRL